MSRMSKSPTVAGIGGSRFGDGLCYRYHIDVGRALFAYFDIGPRRLAFGLFGADWNGGRCDRKNNAGTFRRSPSGRGSPTTRFGCHTAPSSSIGKSAVGGKPTGERKAGQRTVGPCGRPAQRARGDSPVGRSTCCRSARAGDCRTTMARVERTGRTGPRSLAWRCPSGRFARIAFGQTDRPPGRTDR